MLFSSIFLHPWPALLLWQVLIVILSLVQQQDTGARISSQRQAFCENLRIGVCKFPAKAAIVLAVRPYRRILSCMPLRVKRNNVFWQEKALMFFEHVLSKLLWIKNAIPTLRLEGV